MTSESSPVWSVQSPKIMLACSKLWLIPKLIIEMQYGICRVSIISLNTCAISGYEGIFFIPM